MIRLFLRLPSKLRRRARRSRVTLMLVVLVVCYLLIAPFYFIYKPPALVINYFQSRWPSVLWHVRTGEKVVALTIDDGPSEYTNGILELLKANNAKATFFIIGSQVAGREQTLEAVVRAGNELGNHAMHDEPSRSLTDEVLTLQIHEVQEKLDRAYSAAKVAKPSHRFFRPGSGFFSTRMLKNLAQLDYRLVLGSIYPHDPQIPYWRLNAAHILSMLRPGAIIICHDRRSWTIPMLQKVLPEITRRGYKVVTVSELLKSSTPGRVRSTKDQVQ